MSTDHGKKIDKIIATAARTGNMAAAVEKHGADLSTAEAQVLQGLSRSELTQLQKLRTKLAPLGRAKADNNGGIF